MFDSVQNNTWLFFRFITVWISVLNEPSFQMLYSLKNFKDLHMFFKELACFILFSYQCSFCLLLFTLVRDSFVRLSCLAKFVNNFFQLFSILFSLFQRRLLKLIGVLLIYRCRVQQPRIIYTYISTKVNTIFHSFHETALWPIRTILFWFFVHFAHSHLF